MKHKTGDTVRIRSKEWIDAQEKDEDGDINSEEHSAFIRDMFKYAGKIARITEVCDDYYYLDCCCWRWGDWMLDPDYSPADSPLDPVNAVRAMLDGEYLFEKNGVIRWYDKGSGEFMYKDSGEEFVIMSARNLSRRPEKRKRSMTRWEILDWANSGKSRGWVVHAEGDERWYSPQFLSYDLDADRYERARLLPDKSGIDESTVQGFEVEE